MPGRRIEDTKVMPDLRAGWVRVLTGYLRVFRGEAAMAGAVEQMLREVMDIRQAADYLGISGDTLYLSLIHI